MKELNLKQEKFCQAYVMYRNATEAAKAAGYSDTSAHTQGHRLKQRPDINERIEELHKKYNGCVSINTELLETQGDVVRMKAIVELKEMVEGQEVASNTFTGHAEEVIGSSMINKTSALENAETSAVGRALAFAGFQTDASIASADEVVNAQKQNLEKDIYTRMVQFTKALTDNYSSVIAIQTHIANDEADLAREAWG